MRLMKRVQGAQRLLKSDSSPTGPIQPAPNLGWVLYLLGVPAGVPGTLELSMSRYGRVKRAARNICEGERQGDAEEGGTRSTHRPWSDAASCGLAYDMNQTTGSFFC
jgi:hypothetical protein